MEEGITHQPLLMSEN